MAYPADPVLRTEVLRLYGAVWPSLPDGIRRAARLGSDWFAMSTPFVIRGGEQVIAHVGVAFPDLWMDGGPRSVAAVHAVCVHPDHQGRGLGREVMQRALDWIDAEGHPTTILWSEKSEFYARFGFERIQEAIFTGTAPAFEGPSGRRLDLEDPDDRERLLRCLKRRRPVSRMAAANDDGWHFLIDLSLWAEARSMLRLMPAASGDEDAIVVGETRNGVLHLYDVVAAVMPPVARIVGAFGDPDSEPPRELAVYFTPDLLDPRLEPRREPVEDSLHVRGAPLPGTLDREGRIRPFALSPLVRT